MKWLQRLNKRTSSSLLKLDLYVTNIKHEIRLGNLVSIIKFIGVFIVLMVAFPESTWEEIRYTERGQFNEDLILIGLDDRYAVRFSYEDPISRKYLAGIIDTLIPLGPSTIAIDILVEVPGIDSAEVDTLIQALTRAARQGINIVLPIRMGGYGAHFESGRDLHIIAKPPPPLDSLAIEGFVEYEVNQPTDPIEAILGSPSVKNVPLLMRTDKNLLYPSFPLAAAAAHSGILSASDNLNVNLANKILDKFKIDSRLNTNTSYYPISKMKAPINYEAIASRYNGGLSYFDSDHLPETGVQGRLVVIAAVYTMPDGSDTAKSPFGNVRGGIIHLHAIDTLLGAKYPFRFKWWLTALLTIIISRLIYVRWKRSIVISSIWTIILLSVYILTAFMLFSCTHIFLPIAWPVYGGLFFASMGFIFFRGGKPKRRYYPSRYPMRIRRKS